jgi:hypothetical protein
LARRIIREPSMATGTWEATMSSSKMRRGATAAAMLAAALAVAGGARANNPVLDQSSAPGNGAVYDVFEFMQVVTAGRSGLLDGITLYGQNFRLPDGSLLFGDGHTDLVRIALGGETVQAFNVIPPPTYLFSDTLELDFLGTFIDTSAAGIQLTAGQQFIIDISQGDGDGYTTTGSFGGYGGGGFYQVVPIGNFGQTFADPGSDSLSFETFVDEPLPPPAVPEPETWALLLLGFGGLGAMLRRRRVAAAAI